MSSLLLFDSCPGEFHVYAYWDRPPLTLNMSMHWAKRAKIVKEVKQELSEKLLFCRRDFLAHHFGKRKIHTGLVFFDSSKRRRDEDNLVPLLKIFCDCLVDLRFVHDDTPGLMGKQMPIIKNGADRSRFDFYCRY